MADSDRGHAQRAVAVTMLLALVGGLLVLSGMSLAASVVGLPLALPLFLLFSPVLVPVVLLAALAATGMVTSGALALGALALLSRLASALKKAAASPRNYVEEGKRRVAEVAGQKTAHAAAGQAMQKGKGVAGHMGYTP